MAALISLSQKKFILLVIIFHLAQSTSLLWTWHVYTDTYHHPEMAQTRQEQPVDTGEDDDECPICAQLLGALGSCVIEVEIDLTYSDITFYNVSFPHFFYISQFSSQPFSARPPPVC